MKTSGDRERGWRRLAREISLGDCRALNAFIVGP